MKKTKKFAEENTVTEITANNLTEINGGGKNNPIYSLPFPIGTIPPPVVITYPYPL
jgi:hypothetical protein